MYTVYIVVYVTHTHDYMYNIGVLMASGCVFYMTFPWFRMANELLDAHVMRIVAHLHGIEFVGILQAWETSSRLGSCHT